MNIKENQILIKEFPFLKTHGSTKEHPCTYLDDIPIGWKKAFGKELCQEIKEVLIKTNNLDNYLVLQVKEKYGALYWQDNMSIPELTAIINKYEQLSKDTCIKCGAPAEYDSLGYISPFCKRCALEKLSYDNEIYKKIYETGDNIEEFQPNTLKNSFVPHETKEMFTY